MSGFYIDEPFNLPVEYRGQELELPARLVRRGYSYKIHIEIEGQEIIFEPDEERNFRAVVENRDKLISPDIIRAIGESLEKYLK